MEDCGTPFTSIERASDVDENNADGLSLESVAQSTLRDSQNVRPHNTARAYQSAQSQYKALMDQHGMSHTVTEHKLLFFLEIMSQRPLRKLSATQKQLVNSGRATHQDLKPGYSLVESYCSAIVDLARWQSAQGEGFEGVEKSPRGAVVKAFMKGFQHGDALLQEVRKEVRQLGREMRAVQQQANQDRALLLQYWKNRRKVDAYRQRLDAELDAQLSLMARPKPNGPQHARPSSSANGSASLPSAPLNNTLPASPGPVTPIATLPTHSGTADTMASPIIDHTTLAEPQTDEVQRQTIVVQPPASTSELQRTEAQAALEPLDTEASETAAAAPPSPWSPYHLSTRTSTVRELWREWYEGFGEIDKPSVVRLNELYGNDWRKGQPHAQLYSRRLRIIEYVEFLRVHRFNGQAEPAIRLLDDMMAANKWKSLDKLKRSVCDPWYKSEKPGSLQ